VKYASKAYLSTVIGLGAAVLISQVYRWDCADPVKFACYFVLALLASAMKVSLPGVSGTMSVFFLFVLVGIVDLSLPETVALGAAATLAQCLWHARRRPSALQISFNLASIAIAIIECRYLYEWLAGFHVAFSFRLFLTATVLFAGNTLPVAIAIGVTENKQIYRVWRECYFWSFSYYMLGAAIAAAVSAANHAWGWRPSLLILPVVYLIHRSYQLYLDRLRRDKEHAESIAELHLRTIEALALAIEAKDSTGSAHLQRVQFYAVEVGREMGLRKDQLDALRAAALLHDIGKLAVPEHIVSKAGRLTPEEFDKMKIHPVVGAEILERVQFPYPVAPIVRAHHEKWNGQGYPDGLRGEQIPIGARILAAVDGLDSLASERQYRRALPFQKAMALISSEAGKSYDPGVVAVLEKRCVDLEQRAQSLVSIAPRAPQAPPDDRVLPAAGLAPSGDTVFPRAGADGAAFLNAIAAARQEVQDLFELTKDLGNSLSMDETLSVVAARLLRLIPYDTLAIYISREDNLFPVYTCGEDARAFLALSIPLGQGLSGWVARNRKSLVNGDPALEPGYSSRAGRMRSALSAPLAGPNGVIGALTLYHAQPEAFTRDHLRILQAISSKLALSIENALKYQQAESSAATDHLTGLPNARSLFLRLESELARAARAGSTLATVVCDLNGFKQVNDRQGHLAGNKVLQQVARALEENCRPYDYVARMGGDEFVLLMPDISVEAARAKSVLLSEAVSRACPGLSLSYGVALYPQDGNAAHGLLGEADRRMYGAKQDYKRRLAMPQEIARAAPAG
jgi:diguanylate cyclase (GGDEF)-like protein/putative nucleotidyltransferase with HDIG domain